MKRTGFSIAEAKEFREIFDACNVSRTGEPSLTELEEMVAQVLPSVMWSQAHKDSVRRDLSAYVSDITADRKKTLDFGEFLLIMRLMMKENWRKINDAAATLAKATQGSPKSELAYDGQDDPALAILKQGRGSARRSAVKGKGVAAVERLRGLRS